jgi:hypothetical protein
VPTGLDMAAGQGGTALGHHGYHERPHGCGA